MGWGVVFVLLFMTQNNKHDLNSWLNLGVDFNPGSPKYGEMVRVIEGKLENLAAQDLAPVDQRIQQFMDEVFGEGAPQVIRETFALDQHGLARTIALPREGNTYSNQIINSFRVTQGILHNPSKDKRTTKGVFHVVEHGLPIPDDKKAVPVNAAAEIFKAALQAPDWLTEMPFAAGSDRPVNTWLSLLLRPVVCPEVSGFVEEKSLEVRFFAPASMAANLDFVESVFGNGGDPADPGNDAGLDVRHWTGHTGGIFLAPHLIELKKKDLGLPHLSEATERQVRDGMCWEDPDELYNDGGAFKLTCRDEQGRVITVIADNYFGYCKKEVKTQIGLSANLFGLSEEEHAGGAQVHASYNLSRTFHAQRILPDQNSSFAENIKRYGESFMKLEEGGYASDRNYPDIFYVPESATFKLQRQEITWANPDGSAGELQIQPGEIYMLPSGYKVEMRKSKHDGKWRLIGTIGEGFLCHKPCTVSGGGKSEISKSLHDMILSGPVFVQDLKEDLTQARAIISRSYSDRFRHPEKHEHRGRTILSPLRSIGSVIKLLTPSDTIYTDEYNDWLRSIPSHVKELVFIIKREYREDWGDDWDRRFTVDTVDGKPGNELRLNGVKLKTNFLRVGFDAAERWRLYRLREDFEPAMKIIAEDDISASTVAPVRHTPKLGPGDWNESAKFVHNCEYRLFQRPDDAVIRGYDTVTERDFSAPGNFFSNYAPIPVEKIREQVNQTLEFETYTETLQELLAEAAEAGEGYVCSSANPRIIDGKPTANPRYLQIRPDLQQQRKVYVAQTGTRLRRELPAEDSVLYPVRGILPGRRNNGPDREQGIPPLCCFAPIHYVELPELFMDFIASLTGKSPSTTGAGSEGAMTKAPFNALLPIHDLNTALVAYATTGQGVFVTSAGRVGPHYKVDHDISLLIPEIWSRFRFGENLPERMISQGYLERLEDYQHDGKTIAAGRLGYRITQRFAHEYFGRIFHDPDSVFPEDMLRPEEQDAELYAESITTITDTQRRIAKAYFRDGAATIACPPLRALLEIMAQDTVDDTRLRDPEFRALFEPANILASDWYQERIDSLVASQQTFWQNRIDYLESYSGPGAPEEPLAHAREQLTILQAENARDHYLGTLGRERNFYVAS